MRLMPLNLIPKHSLDLSLFTFTLLLQVFLFNSDESPSLNRSLILDLGFLLTLRHLFHAIFHVNTDKCPPSLRFCLILDLCLHFTLRLPLRALILVSTDGSTSLRLCLFYDIGLYL